MDNKSDTQKNNSTNIASSRFISYTIYIYIYGNFFSIRVERFRCERFLKSGYLKCFIGIHSNVNCKYLKFKENSLINLVNVYFIG